MNNPLEYHLVLKRCLKSAHRMRKLSDGEIYGDSNKMGEALIHDTLAIKDYHDLNTSHEKDIFVLLVKFNMWLHLINMS